MKCLHMTSRRSYWCSKTKLAGDHFDVQNLLWGLNSFLPGLSSCKRFLLFTWICKEAGHMHVSAYGGVTNWWCTSDAFWTFFFAEWNYRSKHPMQFQKHLFWLGPLKGLRFWQILFNRISVNTIGSLSLIIGTTNIFETVYFFILICLDGALNRSRERS